MKSKTALQKKVAELSTTLHPITENQRKWAYSQCFEHTAYRGKGGSMVCSECTHEWTSEGKRGNKCRCPKCGAKLTISHTLKRTSTEIIHFAVVTTRSNFQVIRVIHVECRSRKGETAEYIVNEVLQRWFDNEGNEVNIARRKRCMPRYCDDWDFSSNLEIRNSTAHYDNINIYATYPKCRILPIIRRNGFNGFHYINPYDLEKARAFDPFGHAGFDPSGKIRMTP